jgi:ABC-type transport system substrate-binding protein
VQSYWEEVGVRTEIVFQDEATYGAARTEPADIMVGNASFGGTGGLQPVALNARWIWGSEGGGRLTSRRVGDTIDSYTPEIEAALNAALNELDPVRAKELANEFLRLGMETWTAFSFPQLPFTVATGRDVTLELKLPAEVSKIVHYAENARHR